MRLWMRRFNGFPAPVVLIGVLMSVAVLLLAGCGLTLPNKKLTERLYKQVRGSDGSLIKTMVVLPFENGAKWSHADLDDTFLVDLQSYIEKQCRHVRVILPNSPGFPARLNQIPRKEGDVIDNDALALAGRASGVNMVLTGRLAGIRYMTKRTGMLWFVKNRHLARLQMDIAVYHTGTGALLVDKTVFHDIEINKDEGARIEAKEMPGSVALPEALSEIAEITGEMVCRVLGNIPWEGYVTRVEGNRIVLPFGASCGLTKGKTLQVFGVEKVKEGKTDRSFFALGVKIGKISITKVNPDSAEATLKSGGPIPPGSIVRQE